MARSWKMIEMVGPPGNISVREHEVDLYVSKGYRVKGDPPPASETPSLSESVEDLDTSGPGSRSDVLEP